MSENPLAGLTAHELTGPAYLCRTLIPSDAVVVEIRRRLEQAEQMRKALEKAPHAKECQSLRDHHLPGFIHYETDGDELKHVLSLLGDVSAALRDFAKEERERCASKLACNVTGHPCGTDTYPVGCECHCQPCNIAAKIREDGKEKP